MTFTRWSPKTPLEEPIVNAQPDHNFIYGTLTDEVNEENSSDSQGHMLQLMRRIAEMSGTKAPEEVTLEDWDNRANVAKETIGMLRYFGISSEDVPLQAPKSKTTTKAKTSKPKRKYIPGTNIPILGDDDFKIVSTRMKNTQMLMNIELNGIQVDAVSTAGQHFKEADAEKPKPLPKVAESPLTVSKSNISSFD